jgi:hypothetical protein
MEFFTALAADGLISSHEPLKRCPFRAQVQGTPIKGFNMGQVVALIKKAGPVINLLLIGCSVMVRSPSLPTGGVLGRPTVPSGAHSMFSLFLRNRMPLLDDQHATRFFPANHREKHQASFGGEGGIFCVVVVVAVGQLHGFLRFTTTLARALYLTASPACCYRPTRPIHPRWWKAPKYHSRPHLRRPRQP